MEFFEFVLVISLTVGLPITIIRTLLKYKREQLEIERGGAGLTVGELKELLSEVVREANAPLLARIAELEGQRVPESRPLLDGMGEEEADSEGDFEAAGKSVGRRVLG